MTELEQFQIRESIGRKLGPNNVKGLPDTFINCLAAFLNLRWVTTRFASIVGQDGVLKARRFGENEFTVTVGPFIAFEREVLRLVDALDSLTDKEREFIELELAFVGDGIATTTGDTASDLAFNAMVRAEDEGARN